MKLGKTALGYIESVCRKIRPRFAQESFRQELANHLEELVAELMQNGLSQDEAEREAVARMGSADAVSKGITRVHSPLGLTIAKYVCLAITCYLGFVSLSPYFFMLRAFAGADGPTSIRFSSGAAAIGVIGGADGPTALYVSSPVNPFVLFTLFLAFACVTVFLFLLPYINKKAR